MGRDESATLPFAPAKAKPPLHAYNRAMHRDLRGPLHREECRAEYDKAEALGDLELGRWARAWGEAIRSDLRDRFNGGAY